MAKSTSISEKHRVAREWAEAGFYVFPIQPNGKLPLISKADGGRGLYDATTDLAVVDSWWSACPEANIGCAPDASGHFVLDIDDKGNKHGSDTLRRLEDGNTRLPETFTTNTPTGGRHMWFLGNEVSTVERLGEGLDTRGVGGYVLLPGSEVAGQPYTVTGDCAINGAPTWIGRELRARLHVPELSIAADADEPRNIKRATKYLQDLVRRGAVAISGAGGNTVTYQTAAMLHDIGVSADVAIELMLEHWSDHCDPPWTEEELTDATHSPVYHAFSYAQNDAGSKGLRDNISLFSGIKGADAPDRGNDVGDGRGGAETGSSLNLSEFYPRDEAEQNDRPDPEWVVDGWLQKSSLVLLFGPPGSYKSFIALDIALAMSAGRNPLGLPMSSSGRNPLGLHRAGDMARRARSRHQDAAVTAIGKLDQNSQDIVRARHPVPDAHHAPEREKNPPRAVSGGHSALARAAGSVPVPDRELLQDRNEVSGVTGTSLRAAERRAGQISVYAAGEGAIGIERKRRPAWKSHRQIEGDLPFYSISAVPLIRDFSSVEGFINAIRGRGLSPKIIVLDTLSRMMAGMNENDASDASLAVEAIEAIKRAFDCIVIVIHHTGKDEKTERGSSAFRAGFDTVIACKANDTARLVTLSVTKQKDAEKPKPITLKGHKVLDSLAFSPAKDEEVCVVRKEQKSQAVPDRNAVTRQSVGKFLHEQLAYGIGNAVTTKALAYGYLQVTGELPEDVAGQTAAVRTTTKALQKLSKGPLAGYVVSLPDTDLMWGLPS